MTVSFGKPTLSPVLVGRAREVEAIDRMLEHVSSGDGATIVISGEAGVGKSRLAGEVRSRAAQQGFTVLLGHCFESDRTVPYAPLLDILRTHFVALRAEMRPQNIAPVAPELAALLPELAPAVSALGSAVPPRAAADPDRERQRIFHALARFLNGQADAQPVLLAIEDVQWCDETTRDFLLYLARHITTQRMLLLFTYRADDAHPDLHHTLAQLDRERLAAEFVLPRLDLAETAVMLQAIFELRRPVRQEFLKTIHALTDGNPFFIEEVLRSLVTNGASSPAGGGWDRMPIGALPVPRTVEDVVRRRADHLSAAARRILTVAAVAGQRFSFTLLQEVTGYDESELLDLLKELISAQLVVEESTDRFAFRHALTHQAVSATLLARERLSLHRQIAEALERRDLPATGMHLEELAYHCFEAGAWPKALDYSWRAGKRALALFAPAAAVQHFSHALEAAQELGRAPAASLYRDCGQAFETLGEFESARQDYEAAVQSAHATGDLRLEWQASLDLGFLWTSRDYAQAGDHFQRALDLARALNEPMLLAQSLNRIGNWHLNTDQVCEARRYHEEALTIFEGLGDLRGIAETADLLSLAAAHSGDMAGFASYCERAVQLYRALDDRRGLVSSLAMLAALDTAWYTFGTECFASPDTALTARDGEKAVVLAREIGWRAGEAYASLELAGSLMAHGDYGRALAMLGSGLSIAEEIEHHQWMTFAQLVLGATYLDLLVLPAAHDHLERAATLAQASGSAYWTCTATALLARVCVQQGNFTDAQTLLDSAITSAISSASMVERLCWRVRAELALARSEPAAALEMADQLIASAPNLSTGQIIPGLWLLRGEALTALGQTAQAEVALTAVRNFAAARGARPLLWRAYAALGSCCQSGRRTVAARDAYDAARAIIAELAAAVPDEPIPALGPDSLRVHFLRAATVYLPPPRPLTPLRSAKQAFGGLTAREREVAALIARGKTNREIAAALVVGERTVQTHIGSIFAKLGCGSRAQVAAWAAERGLLQDAE